MIPVAASSARIPSSSSLILLLRMPHVPADPPVARRGQRRHDAEQPLHPISRDPFRHALLPPRFQLCQWPSTGESRLRLRHRWIFLTAFARWCPEGRYCRRLPTFLRGVRLKADVQLALRVRVRDFVAHNVVDSGGPDAHFIFGDDLHPVPECRGQVGRPVVLRGVRLDAAPERAFVGEHVAHLHGDAARQMRPSRTG